MNSKWIRIGSFVGLGGTLWLVLLLTTSAGATPPLQGPGPQGITAPQAALGTAFTYQGQIRKDNRTFTGLCDMAFRLYDDASAGNLVGSPITVTSIPITNSLFTTQLNFGGVFDGDARWLGVAVKCAGDADFVPLSGRQPLTPAPYALYAPSAGSVPWSGLTGVPTAWKLTGNNGTTPGTHFLGTTDDQALEFKVNSARALRLEPNATSPGVIGGYSGNNITAGAAGAVIGGGGDSGGANSVTGNYGTVSGGYGNTANGPYTTVGGGQNNTASDPAPYGWATVSGGANNTASSGSATVGGGDGNTANAGVSTIGGGRGNTTLGAYSTIGGGYHNTISETGDAGVIGGGWFNAVGGGNATVAGGARNTASGYVSTVPGGIYNTAAGDYSLAAGRRAKADHPGAFVWADSTDADFTSTITDEFAVRATGGVSFTTGSAPFLVNGNAVQARVSGTCAVGSAIGAVNADGTVVCQTNAPLYRSTFHTFITLDSAGDVGMYPSITIGVDGLGLIAYVENSLGCLKVAHCSDLACTSATITTLDTTGVGFYPSISVGADGLGLISYYDDDTNLSVAHCNNLACTGATFSTLDSAPRVGDRSSITIGADGLGLISYYDETNATLKAAHCSNITCTSATVTTLDAVGPDVFYGQSSITIGADGLGLISYRDVAANELMVAHCSDITCTSAITTTLDSSGSFNSIAIGVDGLGLISYWDGDAADLKVAHCSNITCTTAMVATLDSEGDTGRYSSITIGADGLGLISYQGPAGAYWVVAHCSDVACTSATRATLLDSASGDTAITIGVDGLPLVAHYDANDDNLQVVHCSNAFCTPYFRRR